MDEKPPSAPPLSPPADSAATSAGSAPLSIDQRQGTFISGGTVYGPVVGNNSGTITSTYGSPPDDSPRASPSNDTPTTIDKLTLRNVIIQKYNEDELQLLCSDVEEALTRDGITEQVNLELVGGGTKPGKVLNLIQYLERRGYLDYLVAEVRRSRPGLI